MTPYEAAAFMLRRGADPALIVAYLRLELARDPLAWMTREQRRIHELRATVNSLLTQIAKRYAELVDQAVDTYAAYLAAVGQALVPADFPASGDPQPTRPRDTS
jgi:hypothetical protein